MSYRTAILGLLAAMLAYGALNFVILKRPVTLGYIEKSFQAKQAAARRLTQSGRPKIVLVAGSNGLYSHSCETLTQVTGMGCVNMAVSYITGLETILRKAGDELRPGDIALLPLEFGFYGADERELYKNATSNRYLALYAPELLVHSAPPRILATVFSLSFRDVFTSLGEMLFARLKILRDADSYELNASGDIVGHTKQRGQQYAPLLAREAANAPNPGLIRGEHFAGHDVLRRFMADMKQRNVLVVGSLPTTFDDGQLDPAFIEWFRRFYGDAGARAVVMPNHSRYPREFFYNTKYHLNEEGQIRHSTLLGRAMCEEGIVPGCPQAPAP